MHFDINWRLVVKCSLMCYISTNFNHLPCHNSYDYVRLICYNTPNKYEWVKYLNPLETRESDKNKKTYHSTTTWVFHVTLYMTVLLYLCPDLRDLCLYSSGMCQFLAHWQLCHWPGSSDVALKGVGKVDSCLITTNRNLWTWYSLGFAVYELILEVLIYYSIVQNV